MGIELRMARGADSQDVFHAESETSAGHGRAVASRWSVSDGVSDVATAVCVRQQGFRGTERRRNRTFQPPGYDGLPVLKAPASR